MKSRTHIKACDLSEYIFEISSLACSWIFSLSSPFNSSASIFSIPVSKWIKAYSSSIFASYSFWLSPQNSSPAELVFIVVFFLIIIILLSFNLGTNPSRIYWPFLVSFISVSPSYFFLIKILVRDVTSWTLLVQINPLS